MEPTVVNPTGDDPRQVRQTSSVRRRTWADAYVDATVHNWITVMYFLLGMSTPTAGPSLVDEAHQLSAYLNQRSNMGSRASNFWERRRPQGFILLVAPHHAEPMVRLDIYQAKATAVSGRDELHGLNIEPLNLERVFPQSLCVAVQAEYRRRIVRTIRPNTEAWLQNGCVAAVAAMDKPYPAQACPTRTSSMCDALGKSFVVSRRRIVSRTLRRFGQR